MPEQVRRPESPVDPRQPAADPRGDHGHVGDVFEVVGDRPQVGLGRHPVQAVEAREVDRAAMTAERPLAVQVEVVLEVRHGQFPERSVDGLAVAQAGELARADCAPEAPPPVDRDDVVLVAYGRQVHDQWRVATDPKGRGREDGPLDAVGGSVAKDPPWRPERFPVVLRVVGDIVEILLDLLGCAEAPAEGRQLLRGQLSEGTWHWLGRGVPPAGRLWQNL